MRKRYSLILLFGVCGCLYGMKCSPADLKDVEKGDLPPESMSIKRGRSIKKDRLTKDVMPPESIYQLRVHDIEDDVPPESMSKEENDDIESGSRGPLCHMNF